MAVSRALRRLLHIRNIEEEQSRQALASAVGELNLLEALLAANAERGRRGRRLLQSSAHTGELTDRLAGVEEMRLAASRENALARRIADAELRVAARREELMAKRIERRQIESLIEDSEAQDAIEAARRSQQALDDWHRSRLHRKNIEEQRTGAGAQGRVSLGVVEEPSGKT